MRRLIPVLLGFLAAGASAQDSVEVAATPEPEPTGPRVSITVALEDDAGARSALGAFVVELDPEAAPRHTENFLKLAREGFYQGTTFHRLVPGFIVQGGDPLSRTDWRSPRIGTGGPGYTLDPEPGLKHLRGAVAAAAPDSVGRGGKSSGSQFFVCLSDLPSLDAQGFTVFGRVAEGMDVVDKIARVKNAGSKAQNRALQKIVMTQVTVLE